jgi:hypothetical protein
VKRQSKTWPEFEQQLVQWVDPGKAISMIKEPELKKLLTIFCKAGRRCCEQNDTLRPDLGVSRLEVPGRLEVTVTQ